MQLKIREGQLPDLELSSPERDQNSSRLLPLNGCNILVVEDEFLIADDVAAILREAGADIIGPASSLPEGMRLAAHVDRIDAAVLNIDLQGVMVFPLAAELQARGVRFIFLTGYEETNIPEQFADVPCCRKPTGTTCLIDELTQLLRPIAA